MLQKIQNWADDTTMVLQVVGTTETKQNFATGFESASMPLDTHDHVELAREKGTITIQDANNNKNEGCLVKSFVLLVGMRSKIYLQHETNFSEHRQGI
jgi:hypothetical protein